MNDSIFKMQTLPDTLRIINILSNPIGSEYLPLIGVVLGAFIAFLGNWILAKRQLQFQIQNTLFLRRLDIYLKLTELLWRGGIFQHKPASYKQDSVLIPYSSYNELSDWINSLTNFVAANQMLLDSDTLNSFSKLNHKVLDDLKLISKTSTRETIDECTRNIGVQSKDTILELCKEVHNSSWDYFKNTYKVKL